MRARPTPSRGCGSRDGTSRSPAHTPDQMAGSLRRFRRGPKRLRGRTNRPHAGAQQPQRYSLPTSLPLLSGHLQRRPCRIRRIRRRAVPRRRERSVAPQSPAASARRWAMKGSTTLLSSPCRRRRAMACTRATATSRVQSLMPSSSTEIVSSSPSRIARARRISTGTTTRPAPSIRTRCGTGCTGFVAPRWLSIPIDASHDRSDQVYHEGVGMPRGESSSGSSGPIASGHPTRSTNARNGCGQCSTLGACSALRAAPLQCGVALGGGSCPPSRRKVRWPGTSVERATLWLSATGPRTRGLPMPRRRALVRTGQCEWSSECAPIATRTTSTSQPTPWRTPLAVEPSSRPSPWRPWLPTTIRSAFTSLA